MDIMKSPKTFAMPYLLMVELESFYKLGQVDHGQNQYHENSLSRALLCYILWTLSAM